MSEEYGARDESIAREAIYAALRQSYDPLYAASILEMGMVERVSIVGGEVTVTLLKPYQDTRLCDDLIHIVTHGIQRVAGVARCVVSFAASPLWDTTMMSSSLRHMFGLDREESHKKR